MKRIALLILLAGALVACDRGPDQPTVTQIPPPPTLVATTELTLPTATSAALATVAASPTVGPTATLPATAEATPTDSPATREPTPEASPTPEPLPTPEPTAVSYFAPGQADTQTLGDNESQAYLARGTRFQPLILFVEPENELDVALAAYDGNVTGRTVPEGITPRSSADNALTGRAEILVLSPDSDGDFTFVIRAAGGEGGYMAHLYDLTTPASGMAIQQPDVLAAGTEKVYTVTSRGARPLIAAADPTDLSDIALDIVGADGALLTTANYGGPGGAETAYVLPLGTASYTIKVREVNGAASAYQVAVITME